MVSLKKDVINSLKKLNPEEAVELLKVTFDSLGISGFLFHPKMGAFTISNSYEHRLALIAHGQLEDEYQRVRQKITINNWIIEDNLTVGQKEEIITGNKKVPKYIN